LESLIDLGSCLTDLRRPQQAEPLLMEALEIHRQDTASDRPQTLDAIDSLARCFLVQRRYDTAEPLLREALKARERMMPDDWRRFHTGVNLGEALLGQRRFDEAESSFSGSLAGIRSRSKAIPADQRAVLADGLNRIARLYESLGDKNKADQLRKDTEQVSAAMP
jgi:tetratricopeptide (TPR) repeat protein